MKKICGLTVSLFLVLSISILIGLSSSGYAKSKGAFVTDYPPVKSPEHEIWRSLMMKNKFLEILSEGLNQIITIPGIVTITARECGGVNAYYQRAGGPLGELVMCYELLDDFQQLFSQYYPDPEMQGKMVMGAWTFVFLHEMGHALIDQLDLPITGREEDAVDQLSTVLLTQAGAPGEIAALGGAQWFRLGSARYRDPSGVWLKNLFGEEHYNFSDEHSIQEQRFYNILCWLYGYNPEAYAAAVKDGTLPAQRAPRCGREYQQMARTWEKLLNPYMNQRPQFIKPSNSASR